MSIELISKHRGKLMAVAMLWLAVYHSLFPINSKLLSFVLVTCGYGGVDLFLFLSSFGLYFAYKKEYCFKNFIKRRLLRILPYSIPICFILMFLYNRPLLDTLLDSVGLSFLFRHNLTCWFTSFILLMYILTPIYLKIFNKKPVTVTIVGVAFVFVLCLLVNNPTFSYIYFRTAVFLLGFYFAYLYDKGTEYKTHMSLITILVMIIGWILMYYLYHNFGNDVPHVYPLLLITPGLLLLASCLIDKISVLHKPLEFIGKYTYQFYLIHIEIVPFLYRHYEQLYIPNVGFDWLINFAGILVAFVLAIVYKELIDKLVNVIINKQEKV